METKKKNVSLRVSPNDIEKIRLIADRLGVKESDVLRFSVKQMLNRLAPFQEDSFRGVDLMPAMLEVGPEMVRFFEFGVEQLDQIVNRDVEETQRRIEHADLKLLAMAGMNGRYAQLKLQSEAHADIIDEASFNRYFMEKYFSQDKKTDVPKTNGERMPETTRPLNSLPGSRETLSLTRALQQKRA